MTPTNDQLVLASQIVGAAALLPERTFYAQDVALGSIALDKIAVGALLAIAGGALLGPYLDDGTTRIAATFTELHGSPEEGNHGDWEAVVEIGTPTATVEADMPWNTSDLDTLRATLSERINDVPGLVVFDRTTPLAQLHKTINGEDMDAVGSGVMLGCRLLSNHHRTTHGTEHPIGLAADVQMLAALSGGTRIVPIAVRFTRIG